MRKATPASLSARASEIKPFEHQAEFAGVDLYVALAWPGPGRDAERTAL